MQKIKNFTSFGLFSVVVVALSVFCFGCSNFLTADGGQVSTQFGSLRICSSSNSLESESFAARSLDVSLVKSAKVSVYGDGILSEISVLCASVENGKGSVSIEKIPVGKNRLISVQALDSEGNPLEDGIIRAVLDINPGENTIDVISKETSCRGNVYNALFESGIRISQMTEDETASLENIIPCLEDLGNDISRLDYESIVQDFSSGRNRISGGNIFQGKTKEDYVFPLAVYLVRVRIYESENSSEENPVFRATAFYSDNSEKDVTDSDSVLWVSSDSSVLLCSDSEYGKVSLLSEGKASLHAEYSEGGIKRVSPKADFNVIKEKASGNRIYLDNSGSVNYSKDKAVVAAWVWGDELSARWIKFEKFDSKYMVLELPSSAQKMVIARGKSLGSDSSSWNSICGEDYGEPWNRTGWSKNGTTGGDLVLSERGKSKSEGLENNTFKPSAWNGATGNWDYVDHGDVLSDRIYSEIKMEPSEDDTSLSSVKVNGSSLSVSKRMSYTVPYDISSVTLDVVPNYSGADVQVSPSVSQSISEPGDYVQFKIFVTAKDGTNKEEFSVKVWRSSTEPLDSDENKKKCFVENAEESTITFVCSPDIWTSVSETDKITVRGSFTQIWNGNTKKWTENENEFTLFWDSLYNWHSLTLPAEKIMRPGFSGQPEYRFYKNGKLVSLPSSVNRDYVFGSSGDVSSDENLIVFFETDDEERRSCVLENSANALSIAESSEFDLSDEDGKRSVSNFRKVPGTENLFRSYHPFYPTHENSPLEQDRILSVQEFAVLQGIKSDINLCDNRTYKEGQSYTVADKVGGTDGTSYKVAIPEYYQTIIKSGNVLYVGDTDSDSLANGIIPSAKHVYYNSDSEIFTQWIKQICSFINTHEPPFQIHCEIGVDRTGVFCAVFAGLCGATWQEIKDDYKKSNEMRIAEFRDWKILKYSLENMLGAENIEQVSDLQNALKNHFADSGIVSVSDLENAIQRLKAEN